MDSTSPMRHVARYVAATSDPTHPARTKRYPFHDGMTPPPQLEQGGTTYTLTMVQWDYAEAA